jgi:hypothetical protein
MAVGLFVIIIFIATIVTLIILHLPAKRATLDGVVARSLTHFIESAKSETMAPISAKISLSKADAIDHMTVDEIEDVIFEDDGVFGSSRIPMRVIQTYATRKVPPRMKFAMETIRLHNSRDKIEYRFFDNDECRRFLAECEDEFPNILRAFETVKPGAFKADIFRLAAIYKLGGFYIDASMTIPITDVLRTTNVATLSELVEHLGNTPLIVCEEKATKFTFSDYRKSVFQAFFAAAPRHRAIKYILEQTIKRVLSRPRMFHSRQLWLTGPVAFGQFLTEYYKVEFVKDLGPKNVGLLKFWVKDEFPQSLALIKNQHSGVLKTFNGGKIAIYTKYRGWLGERPNKSHYSDMVNRGDSYNSEKFVEAALAASRYDS